MSLWSGAVPCSGLVGCAIECVADIPQVFYFYFYFNCLVATLDPDALQVLYVNGLAQPGYFCGEGRGDCGVTYWTEKWIGRGSGSVKMHQKSRNMGILIGTQR